MTDSARDEVVEEACRGLEWHGSVETAEQLRMTFDALSARLAQAEQERDEANRWRDSWHDESKAAIATASQFERERNEAEARLREYEEALEKLVTTASRFMDEGRGDLDGVLELARAVLASGASARGT